MLEAQEGRVIWDNIEVETFLLLAQFAYTGDYKLPEHHNDEDGDGDSDSGSDNVDPQKCYLKAKFGGLVRSESLFGLWDAEPDCVASSLFEDAQKSRFNVSKLIELIVAQYVWALDDGYTPGDFESGRPMRVQHFGKIFAEVKLYILAKRYGIENLAKLSLDNIRYYLIDHPLSYDSIGSVTKLIRFASDNTTKHDKLRELVVLYASIICEPCMGHPKWMQLLSDDGDLSQAILLMLATESLL
jgi:hypothetical protein